MEICRTQRLSLSRFELSDSQFILELVNDPEWIRNIGDRGIRTLKDAENYISKLQQSYKDNGFGLYRVDELATQKPVGMCGLVKRAELKDIDLGFAFIPQARGKKYAQESSLAILKHTQELGHRKLLGIVSPHNTISARVLERIGMKFLEKRKVRENDPELLIYEIEL